MRTDRADTLPPVCSSPTEQSPDLVAATAQRRRFIGNEEAVVVSSVVTVGRPDAPSVRYTDRGSQP